LVNNVHERPTDKHLQRRRSKEGSKFKLEAERLSVKGYMKLAVLEPPNSV
jgi:hypothetical protein